MSDLPEKNDIKDINDISDLSDLLPELDEINVPDETPVDGEASKEDKEAVTEDASAHKKDKRKVGISRAPHILTVFLGGVKALFANYIFRLTFVLFAVTTLSALVLGFVYNVTKPTIDAHKEETQRLACEAVMSADSFTLSDAPIDDSFVTGILLARQGDRLVGYAVQSGSNGYGGLISLIVGVDLQGQVTGVVITEMSETAGLGTKAENPEFINQFAGKSAGLAVGREIDAISGATITSKAVTDGVNRAVSAVLALQQKGGVS